ncbi:MAG: tetratricopeptide repeat protein [bacterium]|nr:tetratricopeptide repeat protein [bacterium]
MLSRAIATGIIIILVAVPLVYSSQTQNSFGVPKRVLFQVAVSALLLLFAAQAVAEPARLLGRRTAADLPVLGWLAWTALAAAGSLDRAESMHELIFAACGAALFFMASRNLATPRRAAAVVAVVVLVGAAEALYGIAEWRGVKLLYESRIRELAPRHEMSAWRWTILGTFGNAYHLASYLALACPLALGAALGGRGARRIAATGALAVMLLCLLLTGARGAWIGAAAGLAAAAFVARRAGLRPARGLLPGAALVAALVAAVALLLAPRVLSDLAARVRIVFTEARTILTVYGAPGVDRRAEASLTDEVSSPSYRILAWRLSLRMIARRPLLGSGPGTFKLLFLPTLAEEIAPLDPLSFWGITEKMNEPHNEFLQMAVESGLPSLALFLAVAASVLAAARRAAARAPRAAACLVAAAAGSVVAVLTDAATSIPLHVVATNVALWAVFALVFALPAAAGPPPPPHPPPARPLRWAAAAGMVVFASIAAPTSMRQLTFDRHFKSATTFMNAGRLHESLPYFHMALRVMPASGQIRFFYGSTLVQLGRYEEGAALLEEARGTFEDVYLYKNLGIAYERMGRHEDARRRFERWRGMGIASHEANNLIGLSLWRQGRAEEAAAAFRETLRVRRWDWAAYSALATILIDAGRFEEAARALDPLPFGTGPHRNPEAFTLHGVALLKAGRMEEAAAAFLRALSLDPRSVAARNNLAALYRMTGRRDDAVREWEEVLRVEPGNEIALKNLESVRAAEAGEGTPPGS